MACLTRTEDVRTARGDNHCSEQVLLKILMLACVGYFIAWTHKRGVTILSTPASPPDSFIARSPCSRT